MPNTTSLHHRRKSKGFTLVELLLVLVVAAVISITTFVSYRTYDARQKAVQVVEGMKVASSNIHNLFLTESGCVAGTDPLLDSGYCGNYQGAMTDGDGQNFVVKAGVLPDDLMNSNKSAPLTPWGGTIAFSVVTLNGNPASGLSASFDKVPSEVCSNLVSQLNNFSRLTINGTIVKDSTKNPRTDLDVSSAVDKCDNDSNTFVATLDSPSAYDPSGGTVKSTDMSDTHKGGTDPGKKSQFVMASDRIVSDNSAMYKILHCATALNSSGLCPSSATLGIDVIPDKTHLYPDPNQSPKQTPSTTTVSDPYTTGYNPPAAR